MNNGWVKLHRKVLENPVVCKDSDYFYVWCYLLLQATHKEYDIVWSGERKTLTPGQFVTSRKKISRETNISESKVERIIKALKNEQQIEQQTNFHSRVITILSWNEYQQSEQQNEQQVNSKRTASEQQVNTNKNVKNIKNIKNNNKYLHEFEEFYECYPNPKDKKRTYTNWQKVIKDYSHDEIMIAMENYKRETADRDRNYIKTSANFLGRDKPYIDYLSENYISNIPKSPADLLEEV